MRQDEADSVADDTGALIAELEVAVALPCEDCATSLCEHEALISHVLGFKGTPRCLGCLSTALGQERDDLRDRAFDHIRRRDCFFAGWMWAGEAEGFGRVERPRCLFSSDEAANPTPRTPSASGEPDSSADAIARWDAGELACGDLVLELRMRMNELAAGDVLELTALDPGAPADIPAWCGLTGHALVAASRPHYWIRRRED